MSEQGLAPMGFDLSPDMGRLARRRLRRARLSVPLVRANAQALPFRDGCLDSAVATFPTEFIIAPETLSEVYRVLQPGGRLVIVPIGTLTAGGLLRVALEWAYRITGQRSPWTTLTLPEVCRPLP